MISDTLAEAQNDILHYFNEFSTCYAVGTPFSARMEAILALMMYVRLDLDSPDGPGITLSPVVASVRANTEPRSTPNSSRSPKRFVASSEVTGSLLQRWQHVVPRTL